MNLQTEDRCKQELENLKFKKEIRYIIFVIQDEKIVVERIGAKEQNWESFLKSLPEAEYRYCLFDFEFTNADKMNISKLTFVNWCPDASPIKGRMVYATAKEAFRQYLDVLNKDITLSSKGDMTEKDLIKELS